MKTLSRALTVGAATALAVLTVGVGGASAHVRASSTDATPGGYGEITFRVPNESDTASTTKLSVQLPTDTPFGYVGVEPVAGWDVSVQQSELPEPITTDDGTVTEAPSVVTWTATGAGIAPGQFQNFTILAGPMPDTDSVSLPAVQTYSDGTEAAWIEPTVAGQDEPQYPAPVLSLTGDGAGSHAHGGSADTSASSADEGSTDVAEAASSTPAGTSGTAVAALVVGVVALLAAVAGLVVALRGRRSPTA